MSQFVCGGDCGCVCGLCADNDCDCECHELDALPNEHLKQILVRFGECDFVDVQNLSRNELFRLMTESDNPQDLLKHGVSLLVRLQSQRGFTETNDAILYEIARTSPSHAFARRTPVKSLHKKTVKKDTSKKARPRKEVKTAARNKTAAQKKRERALKRCAT